MNDTQLFVALCLAKMLARIHPSPENATSDQSAGDVSSRESHAAAVTILGDEGVYRRAATLPVIRSAEEIVGTDAASAARVAVRFVRYCIAMAEHAITQSCESHRSLSDARLGVSGAFGVTDEWIDVGVLAAIALCHEEGVFDGYDPAPDDAMAHLRAIEASHPDVVAAARKAVRAAIGGAP